MTFETLPPLLGEALAARGYATPTPVQAAVLEPEAEGRDLIVSAQTGSGKTVAFGLAIAPQLLERATARLPYALKPLALVIAPTRELALQVSRELVWLYGKAGARIATCVGGMDPSKERRSLSHGAHIVVGTPGRLRDHLERGALDLVAAAGSPCSTRPTRCSTWAFARISRRSSTRRPPERRTLLFSATMPQADRRARQALPARRAAHLDGRRGARPWRHRLSGDDRRAGRDRACGGQPAALPRGRDGAAVLRDPRQCPPPPCEPGRARLRRRRAVGRAQPERAQPRAAGAARRPRPGLVATDVAARGIDLPKLSLVVHVELPRDAETLQHRSGRTGRAGKKGIAVLVVPYPRRKRVESVLRGARIEAEWIKPPTPEDIARNDRERLLAALLAPVEIDEEDRALGAAAAAEQSRPRRSPPLWSAPTAPRCPRPRSWPMPAPRRSAAAPDGPRPGFEDTVWFRMDIGRRHNADPRWLLPLLCRRGHITKNEIGAIRIAAGETLFEVPRAVAGKFAAALEAHRRRRWRRRGRRPRSRRSRASRANAARGPPPVRHQAKPFRKGPSHRRGG